MRRAIRRRRQSRVVVMSPPTDGIVLNQSVVEPNARGAEVIENMIPTRRGLRFRGGVSRFALLASPAVRMFGYKDGSAEMLFASTATAIYRIDDELPEILATEALSGLNGGDFSAQQTGTGAGEFLMLVNGADPAQVWDGSTFSASTITGVTTSNLSHVWKFANRLFFVEGGTMKSWYLPVDSIGGAALEYSLSGVFQNGGALLFGATWSADSGDGLDDRCVFVSTEGEVAIFSGTDPSDPAQWQLVGRYDVAPPLSKHAVIRAGGDLLIATTDGIIPMSDIVQKDPAALSFSAVTRRIEPLWTEEMTRDTSGAELVKWREAGLGLVILPNAPRTLCVNLENTAWSTQTGGWVGKCAATFAGGCYIGGNDNRVYKLNDTGADDGATIFAKVGHAFSDLGSPSVYKRAQMIRFAFFAAQLFEHKAEVAVDYDMKFSASPQPISVNLSPSLWNNGTNWNSGALWSRAIGDPPPSVTPEWRTVTGTGYAFAPLLQISSNSAAPIEVELVRSEIMIETGEIAV